MENSTVGVNGVIAYRETYVTSMYNRYEIIREVHGYSFDRWQDRIFLYKDYPGEFYTVNGRYFAENIPTGEKKFVRNYLEYESEHAFLAAIEKYKV